MLDACDRPAPLLAAAGLTPADLRGWLSPLGEHWWGSPGMTTLSHGDPAPTNNYLGTHGARLLDFEYAVPRHRLFDLAQWATRCPLPAPAFAQLRARHEQLIVAANGACPDADAFRWALERSCVVSAAYMLTWLPTHRLLDGDLPWADGWRARAAILHALSVIEDAGRNTDLETASAFASTLSGALRRRWPDVAATGPQWYGLASSATT